MELDKNDETMDSSGDEYKLKIDESMDSLDESAITGTQKSNYSEEKDPSQTENCDIDQEIEKKTEEVKEKLEPAEELEVITPMDADEPSKEKKPDNAPKTAELEVPHAPEEITSMEADEPSEEKKSDKAPKTAFSPKKRGILIQHLQKILKRERRRHIWKSYISSERKRKGTRSFETVQAMYQLLESEEGDNKMLDDSVNPLQAENSPNLSPFDDKLGKCGTTVKKIKATSSTQSFPVTVREEAASPSEQHVSDSFQLLEHPISSAVTPSKSTELQNLFYSKPQTRIASPEVKLRLKQVGLTSFKFAKVLKSPTRPLSILKPSTAPTLGRPPMRPPMKIITPRLLPPRFPIRENHPVPSTSGTHFSNGGPSTSGIRPSAPGFKQIRLQKISNGSFAFVSSMNPGNQASPESFPKAIVYSGSDKQNHRIPNKFSGVPRPSRSTPSRSTLNEDNLKRPKNLPLILPREKTPEPVKYTIPQDMLFSDTDKIKTYSDDSKSEDAADPASMEDNSLFVVDNEPEGGKKQQPEATSSNKNRRKTLLVPKTDEDEMLFDERKPVFHMPPRPQANIDLIENLAKYRALVASLLEKLNMPQIDFNEDGDEYINMYKIFRS